MFLWEDNSTLRIKHLHKFFLEFINLILGRMFKNYKNTPEDLILLTVTAH